MHQMQAEVHVVHEGSRACADGASSGGLVRDVRTDAGMTERRGASGSTWVTAFLLAVPACALLGGLLGWLSFGADVGAVAGRAALGNDSVQPAFELVAGAGALVWNTLVVLAGALIGALCGLGVAPLGVSLARRARRS